MFSLWMWNADRQSALETYADYGRARGRRLALALDLGVKSGPPSGGAGGSVLIETIMIGTSGALLGNGPPVGARGAAAIASSTSIPAVTLPNVA